ncbi:MAG TPA: DUF4118 domain-containing protein [Tepidisphaeraceae bacterium]|jgi:PAS domain S-box-containing protein|nr:DUF4118 domain-containing protein [Tepidisphaeraceae bacterium]
MVNASRNNSFLRYGIALASTLIALIVAMLFYEPVGQLSPFFLFYAAVAVSAWFGGTRPGLAATALGAVATTHFLLEPRYVLDIDSHGDWGRLGLFTGVGALIACLNGALRTSQQRCKVEAAAARHAEARAKQLADANLIGVFFCDLNGTIETCNDAFVALVGRSRDELLSGQVAWRDITAPEHQERDRRALEELRECGICTPFEKDHVMIDGRRVPVLVGCAMIEGSAEDCVGFVLDLTERRRAEAEARAYQQRLQAVAAELMLAEERERRRIASVLHDVVGQHLALAQMKTDLLRRRAVEPDDARPLAEIHDLVDEAIRHTRSLTSELSPPVLYELGLVAAIQWLGDRLRDEHGVAFCLEDDGQRKPTTHETRLVLFQAVRELLVNILKHAKASACRVRIRRAETTIQIVVSDDGRGLIPASEPNGGSRDNGFGLFNIHERLHHLGGSMTIDSSPGTDGLTVTLVAPLEDHDDGGTHE